jgi:hypothetical protein
LADEMLFAAADLKTMRVIKKALEEFHFLSGLQANVTKSETYFAGVCPNIKD